MSQKLSRARASCQWRGTCSSLTTALMTIRSSGAISRTRWPLNSPIAERDSISSSSRMPPADRKMMSTMTLSLNPLKSQSGNVSSVVKPARSRAFSTRPASSARTKKSMSWVQRGRPPTAAEPTPPMSR